MLNISQKKELVENLAKDLGDAEISFLVDYKGLTVSQVTELRAKLREVGAQMAVVKNTLMRLAAKGTGSEVLIDLFKGPNAIILSKDDPVAPAKVISEFLKTNEKVQLKGGALGGKFLSPEDVTQLAKMPSKEELLAKLVYTLNAVPTNFVNVLAGVPRSFLNVLNAVKDQKDAA
ncbi:MULTISPECIES: 50S ribosomal protein L10 [unclassified Desulfobacter]|mgnify:FL=1|jgi:large subunit ribosomal protein L10|uniref:50S ribosomal protein L10 n=1 Tax=unclassified Desulfobacter TaxID=2634406 RepID=UPI000E9B44BF|nr:MULTISPECIES: 50S ribosomal protein L10 [unclassified Desulfobacter]MBP8828089.1 50S ribosomal protein L10 [Desulfobacter sp.]MBP9597551.1 50S ribosomal protein L10 [Desulfobacter sp.]MDQ1270874.1 large subunit ribosomal protein [Thermodesulfobacteriota bacterium]HBT87351.1 50S ribosomal protein L10 [Desulfobacter sp.]